MAITQRHTGKDPPPSFAAMRPMRVLLDHGTTLGNIRTSGISLFNYLIKFNGDKYLLLDYKIQMSFLGYQHIYICFLKKPLSKLSKFQRGSKDIEILIEIYPKEKKI